MFVLPRHMVVTNDLWPSILDGVSCTKHHISYLHTNFELPGIFCSWVMN